MVNYFINYYTFIILLYYYYIFIIIILNNLINFKLMIIVRFNLNDKFKIR